MTLRVLVCDDHPLFRVGLRAALADHPAVDVVGEAADGRDCLAMLQSLEPDVLLLDLALREMGGYEVLAWIRAHRPGLRTLVLSMYSEPAFAERARALGACGFIAKEDALSEIHAALEHPRDAFYASASVRTTPRGARAGELARIDERLLALSPTERRVMSLLSQSLTSREIARRLGISLRTVQTHRTHIADKLDVHGVNRLMELAIRYRQIFS
ncbi:MAG: response regulator transcription factor [Burkholderiaceae bacterium]|nr:response regulator transcription factor [Burkholderiaceae bacterium]